jgi:hypothetical protein
MAAAAPEVLGAGDDELDDDVAGLVGCRGASGPALTTASDTTAATAQRNARAAPIPT